MFCDDAELAGVPYCAALVMRYTIGTVLFNHGPARKKV